MRKTLIALVAAGVLTAGGAVAGTTIHHGSAAFVPVEYAQFDDRWDDRAANVNEREARIRARIQHGLNRGLITDQEARRLYRQLSNIEAKERSFLADGRLSRREDAELRGNLDRLADNVRGQMRDEDRRYSYYAR